MRWTKEIPRYPEKIGEYSELEQFLLDLDSEGGLLCYEDLPDNFHSSALEHYANWFLALTENDMERRERGSIILLDRRRKGLIFPTRPWSGYSQVYLFLPANKKCLPVAVSHSHPNEGCFSTYQGDVEAFLSSSERAEHYRHIPLMQVATPNYNFILMRSRQTPSFGKDSEFWFLDLAAAMKNDPEILDILNHFSLANRYGTDLTQSEFDHLLWLSGINLENPTSLDTFYHVIFLGILENFCAARYYRFGFYYSHGDGDYGRVGKDEVIKILTEAINERFHNARRLVKNRKV